MAYLNRTSVIYRPRQCHSSETAEHQSLVHAYFSDYAEVMMELEGIDFIFSDQYVLPMPIKDYRKYMKLCKKDAKDKTKAGKRK